MKTFLKSWWHGIGVIGLYLAISLVVGAVFVLVDWLPEGLRYVFGVPILILFVPPLAFWTFRWLHPEAVGPKPQVSDERAVP
jgi:hypothetical protein